MSRSARRGGLAAARAPPCGLLLAAALGVAVLAARPPSGLAQQAAAADATRMPPPEEVVVTATRRADAVLAAKVAQGLQDNPYIFTAHIDVVARGGVVTLYGIAEDSFDLQQALALARRIAGSRHVRDRIELIQQSDDAD
jgi:BON domain